MVVVAIALLIANCTMWPHIPQNLRMLFCFTLAPINILAFAIGLHLGANPVKLPKWAGRFALLWGTVLLLAVAIVRTMNICLTPVAGAITPMAAIGLFLAGAWSVCPAIELPSFIRRQSFPLYILHATMVPYLLLAAQKFTFMLTWAGFIVNVCILVIWSLMLSHAMHKFLPRFSKVVFGGR